MSTIINATTTNGVVIQPDNSGSLVLQTNSGTTALTIDTSQRAAFVAGTAALPAITTSGDTNTGMFFPAADTIAFAEGGTEAMRLDSSGNVGIGTASPVTKLDISSSANPRIRFEDTGDFEWRIGIVDGSSFGFFSAGTVTERMRIDSSGNVLVGTTTYSFSSTNYGIALQPNGETFWIANTPGNLVAFNRNNDGLMFKFFRSGGQVGSISVTASNTTYSTSSDYRLKENIVPMTGALDKVALLKPVTYKWKVDGSDGQGFIAHELQAVVPDAVVGEKDAVDAEGKPQYQGVDTSFLVATLTAAIQEQQTIINDLKARVETLEAN